MATPKQMAPPNCKPLRATPFAPCSSVNNLHHYLGHYLDRALEFGTLEDKNLAQGKIRLAGNNGVNHRH